MISNSPVLYEVRRARNEILGSYHGEVQAMMHDIMKRQLKRDREVVRSGPKTPHYVGADGELKPF